MRGGYTNAVYILDFFSFVHEFDPVDSVVSYVGILIYVAWFVSYKFIRKIRFIGFPDMEITTNLITRQYVENCSMVYHDLTSRLVEYTVWGCAIYYMGIGLFIVHLL